MNKTILHLGNDCEFISSLHDFIYKNLDDSKQFYLLTGKAKKVKQKKTSNYLITPRTITGRLRHYLLAIIKMSRANKIILHGLNDPKLVILLFFMPWLLKKCYWVMWGGDLYVYQLGQRDWKWKLLEFFRRPVIKNIAIFTTTVPGDYDLAKKWYGIKSKFVHNLMYPSHIARNPEEIKCKEDKKDLIYVQVGNSADPGNNHEEIFEYLSNFNNVNMKIYCPLSYGGDDIYKEKVINKGYALLGDRFNPITNMMNFDKYNQYMACIDIAIFNHDRQQAMGNIIGLLSLGKKVVIKDSITPFDFFKNIGVALFSINQQDLLKLLSKEDKRKNIEIMQNVFSNKRLKSNWEKILNE